MFGLLNINKPHDVTSRDVVDHVQRLVRPHKAGHAGTLDPLATGVLVVCVGRATRLIDCVQAMPKQYVATFLLGRSSETEDTEGKIVELRRPPEPSRSDIEAVLPRFRGAILQRPPAYSALKVKGRRAYTLARRGERVELAPREVIIRRLAVVEYDYPQLTLDVTCGSGTYIRSLGRDIAESLGTAAVMSALERTAIGWFRVEDASALARITPDTIHQFLLPPEMAVSHLPPIRLTADQANEIAHGRTIPGVILGTERYAAAFTAAGKLVGLLSVAGPGVLKPYRNFYVESRPQ